MSASREVKEEYAKVASEVCENWMVEACKESILLSVKHNAPHIPLPLLDYALNMLALTAAQIARAREKGFDPSELVLSPEEQLKTSRDSEARLNEAMYSTVRVQTQTFNPDGTPAE